MESVIGALGQIMLALLALPNTIKATEVDKIPSICKICCILQKQKHLSLKLKTLKHCNI